MKVAQINITCGNGSTGKICSAVSRLLTEEKIDNTILYSSGSTDEQFGIRYQKPYEIKANTLRTRLLGDWGFEANAATKRLIRMLGEFKPDIVHLHNLHGHNVNLKLLFEYLKNSGIRIYWTFHDCWSYTGYCTYYDIVGCNRWQTGCGSCPQFRQYSWFFDRSAVLYQRKKELFSGLDLTIITPSRWLADEVKKSFFKDYPIKVIYNGIDLSTFYPRRSDFRERYRLNDKKIVLGVAYDWGVRKGLDVFIKLAAQLPLNYQIVLVGVKKEMRAGLPDNIISIGRTASQSELAEIYAAADVFANPTREEVLGLTNLEALACGTPVVTFNSGGSPECIDESCGCAVPKDDVNGFLSALKYVCENAPFDAQACVRRASEFDQDKQFRRYLAIYTNGSDNVI